MKLQIYPPTVSRTLKAKDTAYGIVYSMVGCGADYHYIRLMNLHKPLQQAIEDSVQMALFSNIEAPRLIEVNPASDMVELGKLEVSVC